MYARSVKLIMISEIHYFFSRLSQKPLANPLVAFAKAAYFSFLSNSFASAERSLLVKFLSCEGVALDLNIPKHIEQRLLPRGK